MGNSLFELVLTIKNGCMATEAIICDQLGLTETELLLFLSLDSNEKVMNKELCERMGLSPSRSSRIVARLQKQGYLDVAAIPDNRRSSNISLTEAGRDIKESIDTSIQRCENQLLSGFSEQKREGLMNDLRSLAEVITTIHKGTVNEEN